MIRIIRSSERYHGDFGWLSTYWHFSFSDYHDPRNMNWGALRVFNDDVIAPAGGFGTHPHRDMEIVTYVLEGALEHQDSLGNRGVIHPGEVQVMSAGKGIRHSEYNHSKTEPCHLLQLWILPRTRGLVPRWDQRQFSIHADGALVPLVSDGKIADTLTIDQDAAVYVSMPKQGRTITHALEDGRKAYAFVISGEVDLNGSDLKQGDQARIAEERSLELKAVRDAHLMLLDLPDIG